jgi:glycosyltransferase involved in cell wall biosynthesis
MIGDMPSSARFDDLSVVVPAFCEELGIATALEQLRTHLPGCEIIVVDDASTDATAARAAEHPGVIILQHPFNQGYGSALVSGMLSATRDYVAWFDPDNEHRASDLAGMVHMIRTEKLAAVIAQRKSPSVTQFRAFGKLVIRLCGRIFNIDAGNDLNCGLRVFRRDVIARYLPILPNRFSASLTTTVLMLERGYPIRFFPIETGPRIGQSKVQLRDGLQALYKVLHLVMLFAPMRIFFPSGLLLGVLGLSYGLTVALRVREGFPTAALLLVVLGAVLVALGLVADQISQMRLSGLRGASYARRYRRPPPGAGDSRD